jgi:hypothetical protein
MLHSNHMDKHHHLAAQIKPTSVSSGTSRQILASQQNQRDSESDPHLFSSAPCAFKTQVHIKLSVTSSPLHILSLLIGMAEFFRKLSRHVSTVIYERSFVCSSPGLQYLLLLWPCKMFFIVNYK